MKTEPSALNRAAARDLRQIFIAYIDEGFTAEQAMEFCKTILLSAAQNPRQHGEDVE